jgi:multidrug transporter EmrE-like cation transporter
VNFLGIILYCVAYATCNVCGAALIKSELKNTELRSIADYFYFLCRYKVFLGFGIVFLSAIVLIKALSLAKISLVNPIATGLNFVFTLLLGYIVFQEKLSYLHYFGMLLILLGILLITTAERT